MNTNEHAEILSSREATKLEDSSFSNLRSIKREATVLATLAGITFGGVFSPRTYAAEPASGPTPALVTSDRLPAAPVVRPPQRAVAQQATYKIPLPYENKNGLLERFFVGVDPTNPPIGPSTQPLNPAAVKDFQLRATFFVIERDANGERAERLKDLPKVIADYRRAGNDHVVGIHYSIGFPELKAAGLRQVFTDDKAYLDPATQNVISNSGATVSSLPITDAYVRVWDRVTGGVLAMGYTQSITANDEEALIYLRFSEVDFARFIQGCNEDTVSLIWYYRYDNKVGGRGEVKTKGEIDISQAFAQSFTTEQQAGRAPIFQDQARTFERNVRPLIRQSVTTDDPSLLPYLLSTASSAVVQQLLTGETTLTMAELSERYPHAEEALSRYLPPLLEQWRDEQQRQGVAVELKQSGETASGGGGFGISLPGFSFGGSGGGSSTSLDQLQKTTGVQWIQSKDSQTYVPHKVTFKSRVGGSQKIDLDFIFDAAVWLPASDIYTTTTPWPINLTAQKACEILGKTGEITNIVDRFGNERDTWRARALTAEQDNSKLKQELTNRDEAVIPELKKSLAKVNADLQVALKERDSARQESAAKTTGHERYALLMGVINSAGKYYSWGDWSGGGRQQERDRRFAILASIGIPRDIADKIAEWSQRNDTHSPEPRTPRERLDRH